MYEIEFAFEKEDTNEKMDILRFILVLLFNGFR